MKFFLFDWIILSYSMLIINGITVGKINSVSLNLPLWSSRLLFAPTMNGTCEECLCAVITNSTFFNSLNSIGIGSFNCFISNNTCQFFSKATFYQFWLSNDNNTNLYLFQIPTIMNSSGLVAWHSFDNGSYNDSSGNHHNAINVFSVSSVTGRINEAFNFYSNSSSYEIGGLNQIGQSNQPYSVALWIQPHVLREAPLVHLSQYSDGQGWCIDMLGFLSNGTLAARSWSGSPVIINSLILSPDRWTHVVTTYDPSIGLRLYINGTLFQTTSSFNYLASAASNYITLANSLSAQSGFSCNDQMIAHTGVFNGLIDELRVYSIALSSNDIYALANP